MISPTPLDLSQPPPVAIHFYTFPCEEIYEMWLAANPLHRPLASLRGNQSQTVGEVCMVMLEYKSADDCLRATQDAAAKARQARKAYQRDAMRITRERRQVEEVV